jgi:hypothetical protein
MKYIKTFDLIDILLNNINKYVEARLLLNYGLFATHFLYFDGNNLFDEGIDGEEQKLTFEYLTNRYTNALWIVDNIV